MRVARMPGNDGKGWPELWWVVMRDENDSMLRYWRGFRYADGLANSGFPVAALCMTNAPVAYNPLLTEALSPTKGLCVLSGMTGKYALGLLQSALEKLGRGRRSNENGGYWKCTRENVAYFLELLTEWARRNPTGIFEVH